MLYTNLNVVPALSGILGWQKDGYLIMWKITFLLGWILIKFANREPISRSISWAIIIVVDLRIASRYFTKRGIGRFSPFLKLYWFEGLNPPSMSKRSLIFSSDFRGLSRLSLNYHPSLIFFSSCNFCYLASWASHIIPHNSHSLFLEFCSVVTKLYCSQVFVKCRLPLTCAHLICTQISVLYVIILCCSALMSYIRNTICIGWLWSLSLFPRYGDNTW